MQGLWNQTREILKKHSDYLSLGHFFQPFPLAVEKCQKFQIFGQDIKEILAEGQTKNQLNSNLMEVSFSKANS